MKALLFGGTGMVGQGVLRECLLDERVEEVQAVGRAKLVDEAPKLHQLVRSDLADLRDVTDQLTGYDACFFCLGVSAVGMSEDDYRRTTYDLTLGIARILAEVNPSMRFIYVSGAGTNAEGRQMWARVKGETENELLTLPFEAYMFRPGIIQPLHGIKSKTRLYRNIYTVATPLFSVLKRVSTSIITTEQIGRAMIAVAANGAPNRILTNREIGLLAATLSR
jgi:uncharacterized protein YbjT (DUF2867 family)